MTKTPEPIAEAASDCSALPSRASLSCMALILFIAGLKIHVFLLQVTTDLPNPAQHKADSHRDYDLENHHHKQDHRLVPTQPRKPRPVFWVWRTGAWRLGLRGCESRSPPRNWRRFGI